MELRGELVKPRQDHADLSRRNAELMNRTMPYQTEVSSEQMEKAKAIPDPQPSGARERERSYLDCIAKQGSNNPSPFDQAEWGAKKPVED